MKSDAIYFQYRATKFMRPKARVHCMFAKELASRRNKLADIKSESDARARNLSRTSSRLARRPSSRKTKWLNEMNTRVDFAIDLKAKSRVASTTSFSMAIENIVCRISRTFRFALSKAK